MEEQSTFMENNKGKNKNVNENMNMGLQKADIKEWVFEAIKKYSTRTVEVGRYLLRNMELTPFVILDPKLGHNGTF